MIVTTLVLMLASSAIQDAPAPPAGAAQPPASARRVCRTMDRVGSILPTRICRPSSYWARVDAEQGRITEQDTMHMRNNSRNSLHEPGDP